MQTTPTIIIDKEWPYLHIYIAADVYYILFTQVHVLRHFVTIIGQFTYE